MIAGIAGGIILQQCNLSAETLALVTSWVKPVGDIFLRMIFMMVIPLILSALTLGIAELGDLKKIGRLGIKMLLYTVIVSSISVAIGVGSVTVFQPGKNLSGSDRAFLIEKYASQSDNILKNVGIAKERTIGEIITTIVPKNPIEDMTYAFNPEYRGGGLLSVMFFALVLGIALSAVDREKTKVFRSFLEGVYEITMKVISYGMKLAPFGVGALLFILTLNLGLSIIKVMLGYVLVVVSALAVHQFVTYSVILRYFAKVSPLSFFKGISEAMVTAFSTSSSNATLPTSIKVTIENLKIPKEIAHFVLTIGSTANQNGTALYEGVTVLFLAQCFGIDLDITRQVIVVLICILAGVGTAGVPGGSLPVIMLILISIGIPGESIALIYGVDRILDMCRTTLNVTGDIVAAVYINRSEVKRGTLEESKVSNP